MTISAKIIADSISPQGIRLTTMQLRYPRFIHAEFMTHRMFSRNASSSRAVPVERLIEDIERDPAMPIHWGKAQRGMQAREELTGVSLSRVKHDWLRACDEAVAWAKLMLSEGAHKQVVNRLLEPFSHINVVCTATDYENFFALRRHEDAQPEIKALADAMWQARKDSTPRLLNPGQWHLPYFEGKNVAKADIEVYTFCKKNRITRDEPSRDELLEVMRKISVARCARVSYLTHDGRETTVEEDVALYDRLVGSEPLHASPAEHQATPDSRVLYLHSVIEKWLEPERHGNLRGWIQYRKTLPNENVFE